MPDHHDEPTPGTPLDWLVSRLAGNSDAGIEPSLFLPQANQIYFGSTSAALIGMPMVLQPGSIAVPAHTQPSPRDYWGVYLTLREYAPDLIGLGATAEAAFELFGRQLIGGVGRDETIHQLCGLGVVMTRPELVADLTAALESSISPQSRARLRAALMTVPPHQLLARQPVLVALTRAFIDDGRFLGAGIGPSRSDVSALMLSHAVAAGLSWGGTSPGGPTIGGVPEHIASDMVCNQTLYNSDDVVSLLDRTLRMWRQYGAVGADKLGGRQPAALLESITGLEIEDFLALGLALYLHRVNWAPGTPGRLADTFGSDIAEDKKASFLGYVARTPDDMTQRLRSAPPRSRWDLMAFVETPVLHYPGADGSPGGLAVIDIAFLLEKITLGLYWLVHDHLRETEGDQARQAWTQAWGSMVEAMVEDDLLALAPVVLGTESAYYTEEDLRFAYPGHKTSDVVIDSGDVLVAVEIGSGRPSVETVRAGDPAALRRDLERLAYKKIRQLDDTARCLITEPEKLLGYAGASRPVQPVVVAAGGFFMSPVTAKATTEYCTTEAYLTHPLIRAPAIITVDEVEMLEGLSENRSVSLGKVLEDWKASPLAGVTLRNYLLDRFGREIIIYRPSRMRPRFDRFVEDMVTRLRLRATPDNGTNP